MITLKSGERASIKAVPGLQVQVKSIQDGITLRANPASGNWTELRVPHGGFMEVPVETGSLKIFPKVVDARTREVMFRVLSSRAPPVVYGQALTWTPDSDGLVLIKQAAKGNALILLTSRHGQGWKPVGEVPFAIREPIGMIRFVQPGAMLFETHLRSGVVPLTLPSHGSLLRLGAITRLPESMRMDDSAKAVVLGWACK